MPGLLGDDRRNVCLIGRTSKKLRDAFTYCDLNLVKTSLKQALFQCDEGARAVLILPKNDAELSKALAHLLVPALDNGASFIAVISQDPYARASALCGPEALAKRLSIKTNEAELLPVKLVSFQQGWEYKAAIICLTFDPGRAASKCSLDYPRSPEFLVNAPDRQDEIIIQRAFNEFESINLEYLTGGQSGAKGPWLVSGQRPGGREFVKFVIKTGSIRRIKEEIDTMSTDCLNHIPFPHFPPLIADRCVVSSQKRAIVSMFVDRAILFENYILTHSPTLAIAALFDGPFRLWRAGVGRPEPVKIGPLFQTRGIIPKNPEGLNIAWQEAKKCVSTVLSPAEMLDRLLNHAPVEVYKVVSHGDLHLRNIFVRQNNTEIILIDFSKSTEDPASREAATLDVSLAFDIPERERERPSNGLCLDLLYQTPLFGCHVTSQMCKRAEAIEQLRKQISNTVSETEYRLAVASSLLWHAHNRRNSIAYLCASRIIKTLEKSQ